VNDAPRPPVNEVVLSVALARQPALSGPLIPAVLGEWFDTHAKVESAPPYEIPAETLDAAASIQAPNVQLIMAAPGLTRYWLGSDDDQELIQVQPNYLALNWRNRGEESNYPGFDSMRRRFLDLARATEVGLAEHQGVFRPYRVELTYINLIHPDGIWATHNDTHKLFKISIPVEATYERLSFAYTKLLSEPQKGFSGRLHVSLNPVVDWLKQESQLILTLTARSADLPETNIDAVMRFLDDAHSAIEEAFLSIVSYNALRAWGLK
jgi:uncharacterized protein (TIGR04255 family)